MTTLLRSLTQPVDMERVRRVARAMGAEPDLYSGTSDGPDYERYETAGRGRRGDARLAAMLFLDPFGWPESGAS